MAEKGISQKLELTAKKGQSDNSKHTYFFCLIIVTTQSKNYKVVPV